MLLAHNKVLLGFPYFREEDNTKEITEDCSNGWQQDARDKMQQALDLSISETSKDCEGTG
jgi:hypothetical protein